MTIISNEEERRLVEEGTWDAYWKKREQDKRDEKEFWKKWDQKWNKKENDLGRTR